MDIVDLGSRDQPVAGNAGLRFPMRRLISADRAATILVIAGFGLVFASQWFSWFSMHLRSDLFGSGDDGVSRVSSFGMTDSGSAVQIPYYLIWLVVFTCCSAAAFAPRPRRAVWLGAAAGALAAQIMIVVPIIHRPTIMIDNVLGAVEAGTDRMAGSYCVIAALIVIAAGLALALGVHVRLAGADHRPTGAGPVRLPGAVPRASMHDVLRSASPASMPTPDIDFALPPQVVPVDAGRPADAVDHSLYTRPPGTFPGE